MAWKGDASGKENYIINNKEPFLLPNEARSVVIEYFKQNMPGYLLLDDTISKTGYMKLSYESNNNVIISIEYGRAYLEWNILCEKNNVDTFSIDSNLGAIKFCTPSNLTYLLHFFLIYDKKLD